jgi:2-keto-3-deoxy-6-phosphogluconate aldolase
MTRRHRAATTAATFALSMVFAFLVPGAASASPQAAQQVCGSNEFCAWSATNFGGSKHVLAESQWCYQINTEARSYVNNTNIEGYFRETVFCGGQSYPVTYDSSSRDIGFTAVSFEFACVSCRSGG